MLATLYLDRWHLDGRAVLIGDAAHADGAVPRPGHELRVRGLRGRWPSTWNAPSRAEAFAAFEAQRKPDARRSRNSAGELHRDARQGRRRRVPAAATARTRAAERHRPLRAALRDGQLHAHPHSVALHRSEVQREILENATRGLRMRSTAWTGRRSMPTCWRSSIPVGAPIRTSTRSCLSRPGRALPA